ncbi:hypothetical protein OsJ_25229 [Oryza sativa Japonica Group]|uniref:Uncharacterized protein n=1 Tax=Oryza sativa subsp. japonica TaxID=39947 RepID=A3BMG7_ORYSJ|nr:hypothetical protein OsJ_25229 [Oryza sativa Japonica Group]
MDPRGSACFVVFAAAAAASPGAGDGSPAPRRRPLPEEGTADDHPAQQRRVIPISLHRTSSLDDTPFNYEINKIKGYWTEIRSAKICYLYGQGRMLALTLLKRAKDAIGLASTIMTGAQLRAQTPSEISLNTIDQTVRMYVSTFVKTAEDTYHRKVDKATVLSFLCALQGLAAVSRILFEDALASVRSIQPDYSPKRDVEAINRNYQQEIQCLINKFGEASTTEALEILHCTVNDLAQKVSSYVTIMTTLRTSTLAHVPGRTIASCDAAPPDDRQN